MKRLLSALLMASIVFSPITSYCLMTYTREPGRVGHVLGWPKELIKLVETDALVLGTLGPIVDVKVYCAGDTTKLNSFLEDFAKVPRVRRKVVLHPGKKAQKYPPFSGPVEVVLDVDWLLYVKVKIGGRPEESSPVEPNTSISVDIWLGGQIELKKLEIPKDLEVVSSNEIEGFVEKHKKEQQDDNP